MQERRPKSAHTRFMVLTAGRAGSSLLCDALQHHPEILCFGEVLEDSDPTTFTDKDVILRRIESCEKPRAYIHHVVFSSHSNKYSVIGCRIKHYHLDRNDLEHYICESNIRIIHSKRKNLIAQSLSLPLAFEHEFSDWRGDPTHAGRYTRGVTVDIQDVIYRCEDNAGRQMFCDNLFRPHVSVLEVFYHELCHINKHGVLTNQALVDSVLGFLNLESYTLKTDMLKQCPKPYPDLIKNYNDLRDEALRTHPEWQPHFEELEAGQLLI